MRIIISMSRMMIRKHSMRFVRKDFRSDSGPALTMTGIYHSQEHAWNELNQMLAAWVRIIRSRQPMTEDQRMEIFGGPN
ncbi:hypothetical protein BO78DRAFT_454047, partial [Aspergillus sclerotiicarbonarius CBS 121057]